MCMFSVKRAEIKESLVGAECTTAAPLCYASPTATRARFGSIKQLTDRTEESMRGRGSNPRVIASANTAGCSEGSPKAPGLSGGPRIATPDFRESLAGLFPIFSHDIRDRIFFIYLFLSRNIDELSKFFFLSSHRPRALRHRRVLTPGDKNAFLLTFRINQKAIDISGIREIKCEVCIERRLEFNEPGRGINFDAPRCRDIRARIAADPPFSAEKSQVKASREETKETLRTHDRQIKCSARQ